MDAMEAILTRRSIRQYTSLPMPDAVLQRLLAAAMSAPSANNQQPWQFVVADDRPLLAEIGRANPDADMAGEASVAVLICGVDVPSLPSSDYWQQDCAAATQNLLLAAHALGLGAVWTGAYPEEEKVALMSRLFGLPGNVVPFCLVPIGYPAESKPPANRYDAARIHRNRW